MLGGHIPTIYPAAARYTIYCHPAGAIKSHPFHQENISIAAAGESEYMCPVFFWLMSIA